MRPDLDCFPTHGPVAGLTGRIHCGSHGYRKEGPEGFDPLDAGEAYGPDDY